ncbi:MAG: hypothetical protein K6T73_09480 [Candidatus Bathyarchaeota archaeon]|nr:hypothetical protein [Candidatus Bathyarchaeota archaeon]
MAKNLLANTATGPVTSILDSVITQVYKQKDENIVANLSLYNPLNSGKSIDATIDASLEKPLLPKCSDYKLTIARFRIPLDTIYPAFSMKDMYFQVTFRFNNNNFSASTVVTNNFFSISEFVTEVNTLLSNAYTLLQGFPANTPPYLVYHEDRFCFVFPTQFFSGSNPVVQVILSPDLFYFIGGLPARPSTVIPGYFELYLMQRVYYLSAIYDVAGAPVISSTSGLTRYNGFMLHSEFHTGNRFNDIQSIIVSTNIPIRQEQLPQISNAINPSNISYISTFGILSDFSIHIKQFGEQYEELIYYPQSQFRWIDLISDNQLDRLSFTFWYQRNDQSIHKIHLNPGDSCSIKIYFVSKNKFYAYKGYD